MLNTAALAGLQSVAAYALTASCAIVRDTEVSDGAGGQTPTPVTVATVACRISLTGGQMPAERELAARLQVAAPYTVRVPAGTDVRETDRIVSDGRTYQVVGVIAPTWEVVRKAICEEVL